MGQVDVAAGGARDEEEPDARLEPGQGFERAGEGGRAFLQLILETVVTKADRLVDEAGGHAEERGDLGRFIPVSEIEPGPDGGGQVDARGGEGIPGGFVEHPFGVDEHAVAVEEYGLHGAIITNRGQVSTFDKTDNNG